MNTQDSAPIACTLTPGDQNERFAWIAALNRTALLRYTRNDLVLTLFYKPRAIGEVRELVQREQSCCAFLSFEIEERLGEIRLAITAPEATREAADLVFEQFVMTAPESGCGGARQTSSTSCAAPTPAGRRVAKAAGVAALTLSTGALACGACCVLPIALPAVALAGGGSLLAAMMGARPLFLALAVATVAAAWIWIAWTSYRTTMRPAVSSLALMLLATTVMAIALIWPAIERPIIHALRG